MPDHISFFSYLLYKLDPEGRTWGDAVGPTMIASDHVGPNSAEPIVCSAAVMLVVILLAASVKSKLAKPADGIIPEDKLTLRTFFELLIGYFYDLMKDMMGPKRAKRYFPLIGACATFILFSNFLGFIPGFNPPTASWNVTLGCAAFVFLAFNYYGIKEHGLWKYLGHFAGPVWWMAWLIFPLEIISTCIRPLTLSIRLMLNMSVDHLLAALAMSAFAFLVPLPALILGTLVCIVQTLVFCLLSSVYIALATEHSEEHAHAEEPHEKAAHGAKAHA
jgi:F-type H+-transporting ATPase subunit a